MTTIDRAHLLSDPDTEPARTRDARLTYWTRRHHIESLEARIQMTNTGLAWLMRVKRIGRSTTLSP